MILKSVRQRLTSEVALRWITSGYGDAVCSALESTVESRLSRGKQTGNPARRPTMLGWAKLAGIDAAALE